MILPLIMRGYLMKSCNRNLQKHLMMTVAQLLMMEPVMQVQLMVTLIQNLLLMKMQTKAMVNLIL